MSISLDNLDGLIFALQNLRDNNYNLRVKVRGANGEFDNVSTFEVVEVGNVQTVLIDTL